VVALDKKKKVGEVLNFGVTLLEDGKITTKHVEGM